MKLRQLPPKERPRERLFRLGAEALSLVELLAVLLRTGDGTNDALELAGELLETYCDIGGLCRTTPEELMHFRGMGEAKAATLSAAFEIAKRFGIEGKPPKTDSSWKDRLSWWASRLRPEEREFIICLFLDSSGRIKLEDRLSYGGLDGAFCDLKYVMRRAVRLDAKGVVLIHNHPNGSLVSSREDRILTSVVREKLALLGIELVGHFIASGGHLSEVLDCLNDGGNGE